MQSQTELENLKETQTLIRFQTGVQAKSAVGFGDSVGVGEKGWGCVGWESCEWCVSDGTHE